MGGRRPCFRGQRTVALFRGCTFSGEVAEGCSSECGFAFDPKQSYFPPRPRGPLPSRHGCPGWGADVQGQRQNSGGHGGPAGLALSLVVGAVWGRGQGQRGLCRPCIGGRAGLEPVGRVYKRATWQQVAKPLSSEVKPGLKSKFFVDRGNGVCGNTRNVLCSFLWRLRGHDRASGLVGGVRVLCGQGWRRHWLEVVCACMCVLVHACVRTHSCSHKHTGQYMSTCVHDICSHMYMCKE